MVCWARKSVDEGVRIRKQTQNKWLVYENRKNLESTVQKLSDKHGEKPSYEYGRGSLIIQPS